MPCCSQSCTLLFSCHALLHLVVTPCSFRVAPCCSHLDVFATWLLTPCCHVVNLLTPCYFWSHTLFFLCCTLLLVCFVAPRCHALLFLCCALLLMLLWWLHPVVHDLLLAICCLCLAALPLCLASCWALLPAIVPCWLLGLATLPSLPCHHAQLLAFFKYLLPSPHPPLVVSLPCYLLFCLVVLLC